MQTLTEQVEALVDAGVLDDINHDTCVAWLNNHYIGFTHAELTEMVEQIVFEATHGK